MLQASKNTICFPIMQSTVFDSSVSAGKKNSHRNGLTNIQWVLEYSILFQLVIRNYLC